MTNKQAQTAPDLALQHEVEQFLFRQSELLDNKQWQSYIDLFQPEQGMYWMPLLPSHTHWDGTPSIFVEDVDLMTVRMKRVTHPNAWSQAAHWATHHLLGATLIEEHQGDSLSTYTPFQMMEVRRDRVRHFGGSYRHHLVRQDGHWKIRLQRVDLFNAQASFDYVIQAWI